MSRLETIVDRLFDIKWLCSIDKSSVSILLEDIENIELVDDFIPADSGYILDEGVTRTVISPSADFIKSMIIGEPRVTVDMLSDKKGNLILPEKAWLTTAEIAEILYGSGELDILVLDDVVTIHNDINEYLMTLDEERMISPHFKEPLVEDIEAFTRLRDMVSDLTRSLESSGTANSALAKLFGLTTVTATGVLELKAIDRPKVSLSARNFPKLSLISPNSGDHYDFR